MSTAAAHDSVLDSSIEHELEDTTQRHRAPRDTLPVHHTQGARRTFDIILLLTTTTTVEPLWPRSAVQALFSPIPDPQMTTNPAPRLTPIPFIRAAPGPPKSARERHHEAQRSGIGGTRSLLYGASTSSDRIEICAEVRTLALPGHGPANGVSDECSRSLSTCAISIPAESSAQHTRVIEPNFNSALSSRIRPVRKERLAPGSVDALRLPQRAARTASSAARWRHHVRLRARLLTIPDAASRAAFLADGLLPAGPRRPASKVSAGVCSAPSGLLVRAESASARGARWRIAGFFARMRPSSAAIDEVLTLHRAR
ncbi:hypothetical protein OBBRIDRAFT_832289 [Obba rivulosa]|uniref:Uncharacterized protein n=1 Tax=Obba rivulosa TaxID=1052685 RepID=A0A8E2DQ97_9APHY|nr:hypothetical protein OBBRIDRAFT_832289 [Obba rivulosa]